MVSFIPNILCPTGDRTFLKTDIFWVGSSSLMDWNMLCELSSMLFYLHRDVLTIRATNLACDFLWARETWKMLVEDLVIDFQSWGEVVCCKLGMFVKSQGNYQQGHSHRLWILKAVYKQTRGHLVVQSQPYSHDCSAWFSQTHPCLMVNTHILCLILSAKGDKGVEFMLLTFQWYACVLCDAQGWADTDKDSVLPVPDQEGAAAGTESRRGDRKDSLAWNSTFCCWQHQQIWIQP